LLGYGCIHRVWKWIFSFIFATKPCQNLFTRCSAIIHFTKSRFHPYLPPPLMTTRYFVRESSIIQFTIPLAIT
jgi:hypothetical protein